MSTHSSDPPERPSRLRLVFGAEPLLGQTTGVGTYAWQIYRGLRGHESIREIHPFANSRWIDPSVLSSPSSSGFRKLNPRSSPRYHRKLLGSLPGYGLMREAIKASLFRWRAPAGDGSTLYHEPNYVLRPYNGPRVSTIHDLGWLHYPAHLDATTRRWLEQGMPNTIRDATRFITVSSFVARELVEVLGVPEEKISVTPLGVDSSFKPRTSDELLPVLEDLGLSPGEYLLSVSTLEPRKNLPNLLRAFSCLPAGIQQRFPLVLVGARGWNTDSLEGELDRLEQSGVVRRLGYVGADLLSKIYSGATALALPSLYEGFGLPIVEGMASGVPVLTSNRAAMAEVAGEAALLVDPEDVRGLGDSLEQLLDDREMRADLVARGLARVRQFTWSRTIERTLEAYVQALN